MGWDSGAFVLSCLVLSCLPLSEGRSVLAKAASSCWFDSTVETDCGLARNTCKVESRSQRQSERRKTRDAPIAGELISSRMVRSKNGD